MTSTVAVTWHYALPDARSRKLILLHFAALSALLFARANVLSLQDLGLGGNDGSELNSHEDGSSTGNPGPKGGGGGKAAVAGAGVVGVGAALIRGCEEDGPAAAKLAREASESGKLGSHGATLAHIGTGSESAAFASRSTLTAFGTIGGDFGSKASYLSEIAPSIAQTHAGADMSVSQLRIKWVTEPSFRAQTISELAKENPEALSAFAERGSPGLPTLRPFARGFDVLDPLIPKDDAIAVVVSDDKTTVAHFKPSSVSAGAAAEPVSLSVESVSDQYRSEVQTIVRQVLDELPPGVTQPTNAQLRAALTKALKPEPRLKYSLNAQTGKLSLKLRVAGGEIEAEPNVYSMARKAIYLAAIGTGATNKDELVRRAKKLFGNSAPPTQVASAHK